MWKLKKAKKQIKNYKAFIFQAPNGWVWHIEAHNGDLVAKSGHEYMRRYNCRQSLDIFLSKAAMTIIVDYMEYES